MTLIKTALLALALLATAGCLQPRDGLEPQEIQPERAAPSPGAPPAPATSTSPPTPTTAVNDSPPGVVNDTPAPKPKEVLVYDWSGTVTGVSPSRLTYSSPEIPGAPGPARVDRFSVPEGYSHWRGEVRITGRGYERIELADANGTVIAHRTGSISLGVVGWRMDGVDDGGGDFESILPGNYTIAYFVDGTSKFDGSRIWALE